MAAKRFFWMMICLLWSEVAFAQSEPGSEAWRFDVSKAIALELADTSSWSLASPYLRELSPKTQDWSLLLLLAKVELQQGNMDEAAEVIGRALKFHSRNPRILVMAGNIASDMGRHAEAEQYYRQTLELQPGNTAVMLSLARLRYAAQQWQEVIDLYHHLLERTEATSEVLVRLATAHENLGQLDVAEKYLKQNLSVHPSKVLALLPLERFYRRHQQVSRAEDIAQQRQKLQKTEDGDKRQLRALLPSSR